MTKILLGKEASSALKEDMKREISEYKEKYKTQPKLTIIQIGNDKASNIYINNKIKSCEEIGIKTTLSKYSVDSSEEEVLTAIEFFNKDNYTDGIIVQTPLPEHIRYDSVIKTIDPKKDVDGFHADNMGRTVLNLPGVKPATALGVIKLLEYYDIDWTSKDILVIGRGQHVGLPIAIMLGNDNRGTVTSCHENTKDLKNKALKSDIIISAVGKEKLVTMDMIKRGAIIIDVGINRNAKGKICGDVDYNNVKEFTSAISPVPGGVGPMTIASLLLNTVWAFKNRFE